VVLGGIGNIRGSVIAAVILTLLPELLRSINNYRMLIYSIILIAMMIITNNKKIRAYIDFYAEKTKNLFVKNFSRKSKEVK
jgi:branched-chain amino acid transport system permease protein